MKKFSVVIFALATTLMHLAFADQHIVAETQEDEEEARAVAAEEADEKATAEATTEAKVHLKNDRNKFLASFHTRKKIGDNVCDENGSPGYVEKVAGNKIEVRTHTTSVVKTYSVEENFSGQIESSPEYNTVAGADRLDWMNFDKVGLCEDYTEFMRNYDMGKSLAPLKALLSPFLKN